MRMLLVVIAVLWFWKGASAGPPEGELFGYKLGSKYPITDSTQGYFSLMGAIVVIADKPEKSDDFRRVELITSPKTFTIANIHGIAEAVGKKEAEDIAARYADLLKTLHADKCLEEEAAPYETLSLLCGGCYELYVAQFSPRENEKEHKVYVGLRFSHECATSKEILAQMKRERAELETEGKLHRLEQARKEQKLRGLQ
ncbi:MAG: hypothetical protein KC592_19455 [Nitrospira sp.]|nr:hypothetical protein [Nitrospira sp.]